MGAPDTAERARADEAFEVCARITAGHAENFPVASLFLPAEKRPYIQAVYAFSRCADDFADEGDLPDAARLELLDDWERRLERAYAGDADHPVFVALAETVRRCSIPRSLLSDLLSAFRQDVTVRRYRTMREVRDYCSRSANPVGRIVLTIFGYADERLFTLSDAVCTGLQLANFWQDVGVDRGKDRLYIPLEEMERHGYTLEQWRRGEVNDRFRALMRSLVGRTREMFRSASALPDLAGRDLGLELRLVWLGGMSILRAVDRGGYDLYRTRPSLGASRKLAILLTALLRRDFSRYGVPRRRQLPQDLT